ncbi:HDOD domain-containing protein, partial [Candidatus Kapabacteria bacterium]|nr:HDOD domain-containing protein [Candidatus Kapabacteria bacterium]
NQDLASLPHIAGKILKMIQGKSAELNEIAKLIEADPILTMKILRVANSPIFATRSEIRSIQHALMLLGMKRISNIVLSVSIYSKFFMNTHKNAAILMERFFQHSYLTGMTSKTLAQILRKQFDDNEFVGGLLHDIGKMAMLQVHPKEYSLVRQLITQEKLNELAAEKEVFGENHIEVGLQMAHLWKLPEEVHRIIAFYKFPAQADKLRDLISIVSFADVYTKVRANMVNAEEDDFNYANVEAWKVLTHIIPELKKINVNKLTKHLDQTLRKSPDSFDLLK